MDRAAVRPAVCAELEIHRSRQRCGGSNCFGKTPPEFDDLEPIAGLSCIHQAHTEILQALTIKYRPFLRS